MDSLPEQDMTALVAQYERLVPAVYKRLAGSLDPRIEPDDYLQEGRVGLVKACRQGWDD
ncbi:hypothetical protein HIJ39_16995 [Sulfobacillus sp. DSM 109850]|uniref:RNA polymerase sigma-70 region 2 domain-containing protein n=2 Tax=Sulfobacillus harzensis TaxID=2729629 RepID=A0A7Y0Q3Y1_9FIRM|nr:hypothetical protein [Sulfobacillus harzensis]